MTYRRNDIIIQSSLIAYQFGEPISEKKETPLEQTKQTGKNYNNISCVTVKHSESAYISPMVACACGFLKSKKVAALIMIIRELFEKRTDLSFPSNVIDNASVVWGFGQSMR